MTMFWTECLPDMPATCDYKITSYGLSYSKNKQRLVEAFKQTKTPPHLQALFLAMAMLETNTLSCEDRDKSKDNCPNKSDNFTLFNLNLDMIHRLGYKEKDMNDLPTVILLLQKAVKQWGITATLNYVRGGYTAFKDGHSYDVWNYRNTIATMLKCIDARPELFNNDQRIDIFLKHV